MYVSHIESIDLVLVSSPALPFAIQIAVDQNAPVNRPADVCHRLSNCNEHDVSATCSWQF